MNNKAYPIIETKSGFQLGYPDDILDATHQGVEYPYTIRGEVIAETRAKAITMFKKAIKATFGRNNGIKQTL